MARLSEKLVEQILLSGRAGPRQLNESPVQLQVWLQFATKPNEPADLLLTPWSEKPAAELARELHKSLDKVGSRISPLEGVVVAKMTFMDFVKTVLPKTDVAIRDVYDELVSLGAPLTVAGLLSLIDIKPDRDEPTSNLKPDLRVALLVVLIAAAGRSSAGTVLRPLEPGRKRPTGAVYRASAIIDPAQLGHQVASREIYRVALNRRIEPMAASIETIKADAAVRLFEVNCSKITWAVIDSGIDGSHPAFLDHRSGELMKIRVKKAYDFGKLRSITSYDTLLDAKERNRLATDVRDRLALTEAEAQDWLNRLKKDAEEGRPFDWEALSTLIEVETDRLETPEGAEPIGHGTHVAGVLAGDWREQASDGGTRHVQTGVCPDLNLYDLRVLGNSEEETEYAVIAALEYIRWVNNKNRYITIHGANLSLGLKHNRQDYACGRSPVCMACEATVSSGVVVVAAAGNWGSQTYATAVDDEVFEAYATVTIADPGNAESVITVGATHRDHPYEYGVSFFSSRGPTGDGRLKPDVVAPGEKIDGPLPNLGQGRLDGTSMAAPHVSGVAALLMARNPEMVGNPRRIKSVIMSTASDLGRERHFQGAGLVDALRALQAV